MIRIDEASGLGVALAVDGNGRYARLDPYAGARLALAEAYRNVAVTGAVPVAVTNCLNFGSPEDAGVMWQFAEAVRGLADGCQELGIPVTGGNVSFYNQTGGTPIHPTPIVGVLGLLTNVSRRVPMGFSSKATRSSYSTRRARNSPAPNGRTSRTITSAVRRRWWTWWPSSGWAGYWPRRLRMAI